MIGGARRVGNTEPQKGMTAWFDYVFHVETVPAAP